MWQNDRAKAARPVSCSVMQERAHGAVPDLDKELEPQVPQEEVATVGAGRQPRLAVRT